jgi:hypothetical protein
MIAYKYQYKDRLTPETISVIPATNEHTPAIQRLAGASYGIAPELVAEWFGADQYQSRIAHFPEGQLVALDNTTGEVVGMTSSMRFQFDPDATFLEEWDRTTGYG